MPKMISPEELEELRVANEPEKITLEGSTHEVVCTKLRSFITATLDGTVVTLPFAGDNFEKQVTIYNDAPDGTAQIAIAPQATDKIEGSVNGNTASGVAGKSWINTKATQKKGDHVTLISNGFVWNLGPSCSNYGVWASEP